jgi:hypothetical protein
MACSKTLSDRNFYRFSIESALACMAGGIRGYCALTLCRLQTAQENTITAMMFLFILWIIRHYWLIHSNMGDI